MPTTQDLLNSIKTTLGAIPPSLSSQSACSDIYEAYLFCLMLGAAERQGACIKYRSVASSSSAPQVFVFRTSPGHLKSKKQDYGYAEVVFPSGFVLETHAGVRVVGNSTVLHECDVLVLPKWAADHCRERPEVIAPFSHNVAMVVEAKYYATDLKLHLGRAFLGLVSDLAVDKSYFVANRELGSIETLLKSKQKLCFGDVIPSDVLRNTEAVSQLEDSFREAFGVLKARYDRQYNYEVIIGWSDKDNTFVANVPDLRCKATGDTYEEAISNIECEIRNWIARAQCRGYPIPQPRARRGRD